MDEAVKEAIRQVPALAVLVFLVMQFLRAQREAGVTANERSKSLENLTDKAIDVISDNSKAMQKTCDLVTEVRKEWE